MPKPRGTLSKPVQPILRIFCEGEKTEPNYIKGYLRQFYSNRKLYMVHDTRKNTPVELVKEAIKCKKSYVSLQKDSFWVVYDRESVIKYPDARHAEAYDLASANGINLAISNVCFELWLLLHFYPNTAQYQSCDDLLRNSRFKRYLRDIGVNNYEKGCLALYSLISDKIGDARKHALAMNAHTQQSAPSGVDRPYLLNPYTQVHELLDAIDSW